jgi:hypothetical protein
MNFIFHPPWISGFLGKTAISCFQGADRFRIFDNFIHTNPLLSSFPAQLAA